tara:strand:+ start:269 stop:1819 length:1551 start_codon:yes stop_codon:yes gene_type:complete
MGGQQSTHEKAKKVNYNTYCDIINNVTNGAFVLDVGGEKYEKVDITDEIVDELRPLKGVATDFVVEEFFKTESTLYSFMQLVYNTFDDALAIYRRKRNLDRNQLFFLYKGGNVLRIVSQEFLLELPNSATRELNAFYSPFFKRSDADFSIYIRPDIENYDIIFKEVNLISYLLQVHIRNKFLSNPNMYFDFTKYKNKYQQSILKNYLDKFNEIEGFKFKNVSLDNINAIGNMDIYKPRPDTYIRFIKERDDNTGVAVGAKSSITNSNSYLTISYNSALEFVIGDGGSRRKFTLVRTKVNFNLVDAKNKILNIGGELIDVSTPHRLDENLKHFFEDVKSNITQYDLKYGNSDLKFCSYSILSLTKDLESILFKTVKYPWIDVKYVKRLNRLFYMYFVDIFMKLDNSRVRLNVLYDLKKLVFIQYVDYSTDIEYGSEMFLRKYDKYNLNVNSLVTYLLDLVGIINDENNVEKLKDMGKVLLVNVDFVIKTIKNVRQYCKHDGSVEAEDLYNVSTKELI